jgi:hypothetical protein
MATKSLDTKLAKIKADPSCKEFIIADAKDADMAFGIASPGKSPEHHSREGHFRSLPEYRECIREVVRQGLVDIMLMSAHTNSILTIQERLFDDSHITPAARANDTTDMHIVRGSVFHSTPSTPFRTTTIDHIQCGKLGCSLEERNIGANLGLYSVTYNNDMELDRKTLESYKEFRLEAEQKGFRHFLEVFDPNAPENHIPDDKLGGFINDMIVRSLAGVPDVGRPVFLKMVYHGPKWTEELASYDPQLVIGVLGGSSGTTYDAFKLISEAQKYGARVALFGRKINNAENQLAFVEMLRRIVEGQISAEEAVRAYHGILQGLGIQAYQSLEEDMQETKGITSYGGGGSVTVPAKPQPTRVSTPTSTRTGSNGQGVQRQAVSSTRTSSAPVRQTVSTTSSNGSPDFGSMTKEERLAYFRNRLSGM